MQQRALERIGRARRPVEQTLPERVRADERRCPQACRRGARRGRRAPRRARRRTGARAAPRAGTRRGSGDQSAESAVQPASAAEREQGDELEPGRDDPAGAATPGRRPPAARPSRPARLRVVVAALAEGEQHDRDRPRAPLLPTRAPTGPRRVVARRSASSGTCRSPPRRAGRHPASGLRVRRIDLEHDLERPRPRAEAGPRSGYESWASLRSGSEEMPPARLVDDLVRARDRAHTSAAAAPRPVAGDRQLHAGTNAPGRARSASVVEPSRGTSTRSRYWPNVTGWSSDGFDEAAEPSSGVGSGTKSGKKRKTRPTIAAIAAARAPPRGSSRRSTGSPSHRRRGPRSPGSLLRRRAVCFGAHAPTFTTRFQVRPPPSPSLTEIVNRNRPAFDFAGTFEHERSRSPGERVTALGEQLRRARAAKLEPGLRRVADGEPHAQRAAGLLPGRLAGSRAAGRGSP